MSEALVEASKRTDQLVAAVQGFLRAETWEASRAIVAAEPRLLSDEALDLLAQLADRARTENDEHSARLLDHHRAILALAKSAGVDAAFAELVDGNGPPDLGEILAELAEVPESPSALPRRIELSRQALAQVSRDEDQELWALLQSSLGTSLLVSPLGDRAANLEAALEALETAAEELRRLGLSDDAGRTLNNLGLALESRWAGPADENLERAIAAYAEACEHFTQAGLAPERAEALTNLANAYSRRGQGVREENQERAIELYEQALSILADVNDARPVLGDEISPPSIRTRLNLGIALMERLRGDRRENLDLAIAQFISARELIDPSGDPTGWADLHVNLANALARRAKVTDDLDCFEQAVVAYESALQIYRDTNASLNRALTLSNFANALRARPGGSSTRDIERAIASYTEALELLDPERNARDCGLAWNNLGEAYLDQATAPLAQRVEQAIEAFHRAAEALDERSAPIEYAQVMKNLGTAYRKRPAGDRTENLSAALDCYGTALSIRTRVYGPDHPRTASVLYSIAKVHSAAGDDQSARTALERALEIDEARSGEPPERLPRRYRQLADTAMRLGDREAAERAIKRALTLDEDIYGPDHADVFADLRILGEIWQAEGRYSEAANVLESAVRLEELGRGEVSGGVRQSLSRLADALLAAGDKAGAQRTMERAVAFDEVLFGPEHPRVAQSLLALSQILRDAHDLTQAHDTLERARRIEEKTRGKVSPSVASAIATLSGLLSRPPTEDVSLEVLHSPGRTSAPVSLQFAETLQGHLSFDTDDPVQGREQGRRTGGAIRLQLKVVVDDVERLLADPASLATVTGEVDCPLLGGVLRIERGVLGIHSDRARSRVLHRLDLLGQGDVHLLQGERIIDPSNDGVLERSMSMLIRVEAADGRVAAGVASARHLDFLDQLESIRAGAAGRPASALALERFGRAFFGPRWELYESRRVQLGRSQQGQA